MRDKNDPNYIYIVCAEVYSAFIMGFGVLFIGFILVCALWSIAGSTEEVGRGYQGNTTIIYYEYNDTGSFGCGGGSIAKIIRYTYKFMTIFGVAFPVLIIICLNRWLMKTAVILEVGWNIFIFVNIKMIQKHLKNTSAKKCMIIEISLKLYIMI